MPKSDWEKNTIVNIFSERNMWPFGDKDIVSILDVACGLSLKSKFIPADIRVGVDIYEKYFEHIEADVPYVVLKYDVRKLSDIFVPKSFDLVIALDVIEHLEKEESLAMIKQCEQIARKAVVLETPLGYIPQNIDILGHGGHEFQTHRCGWEAEELENLGYTVITRDYEMSQAKRHTDLEVASHIKMIDAIKILNTK